LDTDREPRRLDRTAVTLPDDLPGGLAPPLRTCRVPRGTRRPAYCSTSSSTHSNVFVTAFFQFR
ncbi:hypothetical protein ACFVSK_19240, partial [Cellulosimicrobium cellulans]|uniref:hypothetical protein n=1 Tax=Cellulosimicrobium cellulans TaxID=1710 RepID=UPI0036EBBC58